LPEDPGDSRRGLQDDSSILFLSHARLATVGKKDKEPSGNRNDCMPNRPRLHSVIRLTVTAETVTLELAEDLSGSLGGNV
jgi:hypothetical protein